MLSTPELIALIRRVFDVKDMDRSMALLTDLPDDSVPDNPAWAERRELLRDWWQRLEQNRSELKLDQVNHVTYRNVHRNNADLPVEASIGGRTCRFREVFDRHSILMAVTEFSATAPLKLLAPRYGFRAATMPGFHVGMIPALRVDYEEISRRCDELKSQLDEAVAAHLRFEAGGSEQRLMLDLRYRKATASGGLVHKPGTAGNLPSGETYIVPYEGERPGDASRSRGVLPLELEGELIYYHIEANRVVKVDGAGPQAARERQEMSAEPAYANIAELGFGVLRDYGIQPVGTLLLDEKLGLHIAFGRSDHFGGSVGAKDFSTPDRVVHLDRVYIPEVQPLVRVAEVDLELAKDGSPRVPLMRDGAYVHNS